MRNIAGMNFGVVLTVSTYAVIMAVCAWLVQHARVRSIGYPPSDLSQFYMVEVRLQDGGVSFTADLPENEIYLKEFFKSWQQIIDMGSFYELSGNIRFAGNSKNRLTFANTSLDFLLRSLVFYPVVDDILQMNQWISTSLSIPFRLFVKEKLSEGYDRTGHTTSWDIFPGLFQVKSGSVRRQVEHGLHRSQWFDGDVVCRLVMRKVPLPHVITEAGAMIEVPYLHYIKHREDWPEEGKFIVIFDSLV